MTTQPTSGQVPAWTLGDRLRKARTLTGMTTREFALRIGVSHGTITNAEGDKRAVRPITLNAWSDVTGVSRGWLEFGVGDPNPDGQPADTMEALARLAAKKQRHADEGATHRYVDAA